MYSILTHFSCKLTPSLFSLCFRPPRQLSLCAPAVPLLWLEFVLLCFRMATIEATPTSTHPTPFLFHLRHPSPCVFPLVAQAQRIGERRLLYPVQVFWVGEKGHRGCGRLSSGGEFIQPRIPHLWQVLTHMSQPVIPGLWNLCG